MKRALFTLTLMIACAAPAVAEESIWREAEGSFGPVYSCGTDCAAEAMQCSREMLPDSVGISLEDLIASSSWEQFDYYFLAEIAQRRQDRGVIGGKRVAGPDILMRDGRKWLVSLFDMQTTSDPALQGKAVMWLGGANIDGLKCSYVPTGNEDTLIQSLIDTLSAET